MPSARVRCGETPSPPTLVSAMPAILWFCDDRYPGDACAIFSAWAR